MAFIRYSETHPPLQYALSLLVVATLTGMILLVQNQLSIQVIALLYLLPVVLCARLWGLGPGIFTAVVSFLGLNYFFIPPFYTLSVHRTQDLIALLVFLVIAVVISQLLGQDQESIASATSREREATHLYELSVALSGQLDEAAIAQILADHLCETIKMERVEVTIKGRPGSSTGCKASAEKSREVLPAERKSPDSSSSPNGGNPAAQMLPLANRKPERTVPLATTRGPAGSLRIWRLEPFSQSEERLLSTFTSQAALAVERAVLVQTDTHARVLEESDRLKSALLSSVSHELRSPLATIKASISSLRTGAVESETEAGQDLLTAIEEETDHLNQLVGNILDMSRIETGALNPQRRWNALSEIVGSVLRRMSPAIQNHRIVVDIPSDVPPVPVDYVQMEQVFTNLISNSVKYAPPGSEVTIQALRRDPHTVQVKVTNQGPPVAEENLERIFDKFYRVTAADKVTGTGLGLSICKGIVEAHGGHIWAENAPGHFIFNFTLPVSWDGELPQAPKED